MVDRLMEHVRAFAVSCDENGRKCRCKLCYVISTDVG
jgi:hypothetical protein